MPRARDHQSTSSSSQQSLPQPFGGSFEPFPPLVEDHESNPEPEAQGLYSGNVENAADDYEDDNEGELDEEEEEEEDQEEADFRARTLSSASESEEISEGDSAEEDDDDDEDTQHGIGLHHPLFRSTSSLTGPNAFAPPFYNRPPTPLPPSPSLTSLLRPTFSATTSRPTTPDSSDVETPNDTEAAVAKSARDATTVPRASPKVPTYEYYGFVLYLASSLAFLMYLLWSYLPSPFLHQLGIHYYPNRWWSLAIPAYLVMTIVYIYVALAAYNTGYLTLPLTSVENLVDEAANVAVVDSKGRRRPGGSEKMNPGATTALTMGAQKRRLDWRAVWSEGTDAVMDVPIGGVCEVLYGGNDEEEEDENPGRKSQQRVSTYRPGLPFMRDRDR